MLYSSNQQRFIPRRRSTSDQTNHYIINITSSTSTNNESTTPLATATSPSQDSNNIYNHSNRSLMHLPSNTTFIIHSDDGTELTLIPANDNNNNTLLNRAYSELSPTPPLRAYETINLGDISNYNKRRLRLPKILRRKSSVLAYDDGNSTNIEDLPNQINYLDSQQQQQQQSDGLNDIMHNNNSNDNIQDNYNDDHTIDNNDNNDNTEGIDLQRRHSNTLQSQGEMTHLEPTPSRFSFINRHSSHRRSLRSLSRSILRPELSRPPTYKRYENPEQEAQQARDMEALRQLQRHYNDNDNRHQNGLLDLIFYVDGEERPKMKKALFNTFMNQFIGFYMAFWLVALTFLGAVSVFVPDLPWTAKLLWLPLGFYCLGAIWIIWYRYQKNKTVLKLEEQIDRARQRRVNELLSNMELPNDHYFVIEQGVNGHAHPVVKLIPPPPVYSLPSSSSSSTNRNLNLQNHPTVHIDLSTATINSRPPSIDMGQLSHPNLIHSSSSLLTINNNNNNNPIRELPSSNNNINESPISQN